MFNIGLVFALGLLLTACSSNHMHPHATQVATDDVTIKLSYQYNGYEAPILSEQRAIKLAVNQCQAKGFSNAVAQ